MRGTRQRKKRPGGTVGGKKVIEALRMISEGRWTIRRAANHAGLSYYEILDEMAKRGIDSGPRLRDLKDPLTVLIGRRSRFRNPVPVRRLEELSEDR